MGVDFRKGYEMPAIGEPQKNNMLHEEAGQVPEASALLTRERSQAIVSANAPQRCAAVQEPAPSPEEDRPSRFGIGLREWST